MAGLLQRAVLQARRWLKVEVLREVGRQYPLFCCLLSTLLLLTVLLNRYIHILLVFWSFLAGVITFYCSLGPGSLSSRSCSRWATAVPSVARPTLLLENYQPWLDLKVHSKVDASVAEVFELVLENFVYPWYRDITDDEACVDELRLTFRFFASVVVRRAMKVDVPVMLAGKVMKAAAKHMEILAREGALAEYGADLHTALRSRRDELLYLRSLTEMLFSHVLPPKAPNCRSLALLLREVVAGSVMLPTMDFMADPDTVNLMVLMFVDDTPPDIPTEPPSPLVPFLQRYAEVRNKKASVLKLDLKEIREQQDLLFRFMNFLKQEGAVHVLQFCLTVEEFNDKILMPELSEVQLQALHSELQHIHSSYCLDQIAEGPYPGVVRLQTLPCLFKAYEHVLFLLEHYFRYLLKGAESTTRNSKMNRNASRRGEAFGIGRIGSKIRGVFKNTTLEGSMLPESLAADTEEPVGPSHPHPCTSTLPHIHSTLLTPLTPTPPHIPPAPHPPLQVEEATVVLEDEGPVEVASAAGTLRNLSAWTISIPYIDLYDDEAKRERIPVFCIDVERNDRKEVGHEAEKWSVLRRYLEFYVLESKLTEFHDAQLPSKRILGPKNYEFLVSKKDEFEEYLQVTTL
ncbi:hypothetical protein CRUP_028915 [Coryphaenoides rupestris]|nr:hypothetical protein CRUP_028915 [Coryphaenoides rupestris]